MDRSTQKIGVINLLALLVVGAAAFGVARYANSPAAGVTALFLGLGALVAAVSGFQMRLEDRERLEKFELEELARAKGSATLFAGREEGSLPAEQSRRQFEKFFVPGFTLLLLALEAGAAWFLWRGLGQITVMPLQNQLVAMGLGGMSFLVLFLLGKYSAGITRLEDRRLLSPGAGWLLLGAYLCLLVTVGVAAEELGVKRADFHLTRGLTVLLALLAAETLISLVLEIYRPRVRGKVARPLYESRLVGLLAHPEGLFTTAAQTLDYQFGFKVSETWVYRVLVEKLPGFLLGLAAALVLSSCFVFLEPGEQALLERLGRPLTDRTPLGPGAHFKLPWPIDRVYRFNVGEVRTFNVGFVPDPKRENENTILWTVAHYKEEFNFLVASRDLQTSGATNEAGNQSVPVNLLAASIPVQYRIADVRAWAYGYSDAQALLEQIATREVVRFLAGADLLEVMTVGRDPGATELRRRIQARAAERELGVEILFVGLQGIHPPVPVAADYQAVNGAAQEVRAKQLRAEGDALKTGLLTQAQALETVRGATGEALRRTTAASAQAGRFPYQLAAYQAAPEFYPNRLYLQTLARASAATRKYIIAATNTHEVIQLNLEDKLRPELYDIQLTPEKK